MEAMNVAPAERPEVRWMVDPNDYLRPLVYDPKDIRWADKNGHGSDKGSRASNFCGDDR